MKMRLVGLLILFLTMLVNGEKPEFVQARHKMVKEQILQRGITDRKLLDAFLKVKRHLFVKPEMRNIAYSDLAVPIDEGQSLSQPYLVAIMVYVIAPAKDKKILDIGTGTGYLAAILAELGDQVYTIEINKKLTKKARNRLNGFGYKNIKIKTGDGYLGWEEYGPFDGIIVTCSPDHIPPPLIQQLAVGGKMVIPVSYASKVQELILLEKEANGELKKTSLIPVQFVPLRRGKNGK